MNEMNVFSTRFIMIKEIFNNEKLLEIFNKIKKDTEKLTDVMHAQYGPTYRSNYHIADIHWLYFKSIFEKLNQHLDKSSLNLEITQPPWYSEYGEYDQHGPHIHGQKQIDLMFVQDAYKYSGIINLSNFGKTLFINPNPSSFYKEELAILSKYGTVILFPSNVWHYVPPHGLRDKFRATFSFNGLLRGLDINAEKER